MGKIIIKENELQKIISESVKKVLNEVSSDVAFRAYDEAKRRGRKNQSRVFLNYGENRIKNELGDNQNICVMNHEMISYLNTQGDKIHIQSNGYITAVRGCDVIDNYDNWQKSFKEDIKTNKETARIVVKWINKYIAGSGTNINPELLDWHLWAYL